jgi:formylmethanofuran dehydrogenase subunit C
MDLAVAGSTKIFIFYGGSLRTGNTSGADVILTNNEGEGWIHLAAGDFNVDGKTDLVVGDAYYPTFSSPLGRVYIFYGGSLVAKNFSAADVIISSEGVYQDHFGFAFAVGDFNADGRTDLAVSDDTYNFSVGRVYIFYGGSIVTENASGADVKISGPSGIPYFGSALTAGDFNADGEMDLAVGAEGVAAQNGSTYIFYNDGSIPTTAATADVTITGEADGGYFGDSLASGDVNSNGTIDLIVGAKYSSSNKGRAYIFYNDGSIPTAAATADVIITGETAFGAFSSSLAVGDFNSDGKTDLIVGADAYSSSTGRAYIFYNDSSLSATAATADVIITGQGMTNSFGVSLTIGDFNADSRTDLAVGASSYASSRGRAYIFYSQNGQVNTNQSITGETTSNYLGYALTTGDFNADGRTDLAVGAYGYSTETGRVYLFYGDGQVPSTAATADVIITGESSSFFGSVLTAGDLNADGKTDLIVSGFGYSGITGRAYIFYNDGSIPTTAATADVIITGGTSNNNFGISMTPGDFNADGKFDLAVGASGYSSFAGRAYIFYNDGSIPTTAATADVMIDGEAGSFFSFVLSSGDFNADGKTDLVAATQYYSPGGRTYIFYSDGSIPTTAATADVIITGEASSAFGTSLVAGDFNADGKTDLAVGASSYSSATGRTYLFYNGSIITEAATGADIILTGEASSSFGASLVSGDFNADGKIDLAVGASAITTNTGKVYYFYNDGSIPTTAATADVTIAGETTSNYFGSALGAGDMNGDGRTDLIVGAYGNSTNTGRVYFYETRENFAWEIQEQFAATSGTGRTGVNGTGQEIQITGEGGSSFGRAMTTGDFNADGRTDLAIGAYVYATSTGRVYIFYGDGSIAVGASSADVVLTGETTSNRFGLALAAGDWNADGKTDLAVGAQRYSSYTGRAYIFYNGSIISENATGADVIITGEATNNNFGSALMAGDLNSDGRVDLIVGTGRLLSSIGRVYIFYNGAITNENASGADVTITGDVSGSTFGIALAVGDYNADGKTDLAVGASIFLFLSDSYAYIFYNDGSIPTTSATADITITGEGPDTEFGSSLASGDYNADGKIDLAVGAIFYSSFSGRVYIFYNGSIITENASGADVIITGEASSQFGSSLASGDWNADGKTDLAVGAYRYSSFTGRAYLFYNGSIITENASGADIILTGETANDSFGVSLASGDWNADGKADLAIGAYGYASSKGKVYIYTFNDPVITGETTSNFFGVSLTSGDFNTDGKTDLAVGAYGYSTNTGRAYIFYQGAITTETATGADIIITGETTTNYFGWSLASGDWNADGKTDLAVSSPSYSSYTGRAYLFYNGSIITENASGADVKITGETTSNYFGYSLTAGDFNADGRTDLAVGAYGYSSSTGRAYLFYNDGSIPTTAATADIILTGDASSQFGYSLVSGDWNADGKTDLAVGANAITTNTGKVYFFSNDGSYPTTAATADVTITGETTNNYFGESLTTGDFNTDGKTDLAVGAYGYSTNAGRAYLFYNGSIITENASGADIILTGETTSNAFGISLSSGDWNADGRTDLAVGAYGYSSSTGRAYLFYNGSIITENASGADIILTGETTSNYFGSSLASGDWNADGRIDLAVGASAYDLPANNTGRVYLFTSEVAAALQPPGGLSTKGGLKIKGGFKLK